MAKSADDKFDPQQYAEETTKSIDSIQNDMNAIDTRVKTLEDRVGDHASLANSFKVAFEKDKDVDKVLTDLLTDLMGRDAMRKALNDAVRKADKRWLIAKLKSIWGFIIAIILLFVGGFAEHIFGK